MAFKDQISGVINQLHDVGGLKFGDYMMKSGRRSPIYVDLRVIISHPKLMVCTSSDLISYPAGI
jgi:uridine monophosphate synthetase